MFREDDEALRWPSKSNDGWRGSTARTLSGDELMKVQKIGSSENFVGKWEELIFDNIT